MHPLAWKLGFLGVVACAPAQAWWIARGPDGGTVSDVAVSTAAIHAATNDGVYRSLDDGASWTRVELGARGARPSDIVASPDLPEVVLAAIGDGLWRSSDGGASWASVAVPMPALRFAFGSVSNEVLAVSAPGNPLLRSSNAGLTWTTLAPPASALQASTLAADPNGDYYYAIDSAQQLRRSPDGGATWTALTSTLAAPGMASPLLVDPANSDTVLIASNNLDASYVTRYSVAGGTHTTVHHAYTGYAFVADPFTGGRLWFSARTEFPVIGDRLFESNDHGMTWTDVNSDRAVRLLAADHRTAGRLYGTSASGMEWSGDAGRHWESRMRGIPLASVTSLSIDPRAPSMLLAATEANGIARSDDGGASWTSSSVGLTSPGVIGLVRSPSDADRVHAGTQAGLFRSIDGGLNWNAVPLVQYPSAGVPRFSHLTVDRTNPQRLAAVEGLSRVMWSDDGGSSWRIAAGSNGIRRLAASAQGSGRVYGLAWLTGTSHRLRRADSHGADFFDVSPSTLLSAIAVHPDDDAIVIGVLASSAPYPVVLSNDGGLSWQARGAIPATTGPEPQVRFDPCTPGMLHAANGSAYFRSDDLGLTWRQELLTIPSYTIADLAVACTKDLRVIAQGSSTTGAQVRSETADRVFADGFEPL